MASQQQQQPPFAGPPRPMPPIGFPGPAPFPLGMPPPPGFPFRPGMPPMGAFPARPAGPMPGLPLQMLRPPGSQPVVLPKPAGSLQGMAPRPLAPPEKSTTVYVGKIAASVDDSLIRSLLDACGTVRSWKPLQDPETQKPKGFGFCEFEDAEGVLRALRLLNSLSLDGQELLLKCNTATQKYVDDFSARKEAEAIQKRARASAQAALDEKLAKQQADGSEEPDKGDDKAEAAVQPKEEDESDDAADNRVLEVIMSLVSEREGAKGKKDAQEAADTFLSSLPGPPPRPGDARGGRARESSRADRDAEKRAEADLERRRQQERKDRERRLREADASYGEALRNWERFETSRRAELDREFERERDVAKERLRSIRAEAEALSDTEEEPWRRPLYTSSRRYEDRKRRREKEEREDAADREAEAAAKAAARESAQAPILDDIADAPVMANGALSPPASDQHSTPKAHVDPNDPIYQAMIAAAKAGPGIGTAHKRQASATPDIGLTPPHTGASPLRSPTHQGGALAARGAPSGPPPAKKPRVLAAFGGEDEEERPKRRLIPLQYSEEELRAAQAPAEAEKPPAAAPQSAEATQKAIKALIKSIPSDRAGVFAYPINWNAYDTGRSAMAGKILAWVKKKVQELMGAEEASMIEFVMGQLNDHTPPATMHAELAPVLDEESDNFVLKLYRMVIFETQKHAQGLQDTA